MMTEMKLYEGTKRLLGVAMTLGQYNTYRGWEMLAEEGPLREGYLVEYEELPDNVPNHPDHKGYISWSPKGVFEKTYKEIGAGELHGPGVGIGSSSGYSTGQHVGYTPQHPDNINKKSLGNTDTNTTESNVKDVVFWGDGGMFKLICKAFSENEGWMKSTKAMQVHNGCVVQVTTQQRNSDGSYSLAEAVTFVPGVGIDETTDGGNVIARELVKPVY